MARFMRGFHQSVAVACQIIASKISETHSTGIAQHNTSYIFWESVLSETK